MRFKRDCHVLVWLASLCVMGGCWSFRAGESGRTGSPLITSLAPDSWPARDAEVVCGLRDATPPHLYVGQVYKLDVADHARMVEVGNGQSGRLVWLVPVLPVSYKGVHGEGLLRLVSVPRESVLAKWVREYSREQRERYGFVPSGWYLTSRALHDPRVEFELERVRAIREGLARVDAINPREKSRLEAMLAPDDALVRTGLAIKLPDVQESPPRGLIIHMHSLLPNRFEPRVLEEFRRRGWAVVTLFTSTGVSSGYSPQDRRELERLRGRMLESMRAEFDAYCKNLEGAEGTSSDRTSSFLRRLQSKVHAPIAREVWRVGERASYQACWDADAEPVGRSIALATDDALASNAYAVEGVLDYIRAHRPDIDPEQTGTPLVVVGFSAGAFATPAAVVRVKDRVSCVVLVGGGANLFGVAQESSLTDGGLRLRCGKQRVSRAVRDAVGEVYLRESRLDPYHTAPMLRDLPVLQVHAAWDAIVPARYGELLHERLGLPDLMMLKGGHTALFVLLPGHAREIADWVERQVSRPADASQKDAATSNRHDDASVEHLQRADAGTCEILQVAH